MERPQAWRHKHWRWTQWDKSWDRRETETPSIANTGHVCRHVHEITTQVTYVGTCTWHGRWRHQPMGMRVSVRTRVWTRFRSIMCTRVSVNTCVGAYVDTCCSTYWAGGLHYRCRVHSFTKQAIARHLEAHHPRHHWSRVQPCGRGKKNPIRTQDNFNCQEGKEGGGWRGGQGRGWRARTRVVGEGEGEGDGGGGGGGGGVLEWSAQFVLDKLVRVSDIFGKRPRNLGSYTRSVRY